MNQPNYLNWPQYDDEVANKAYVDSKLQDIDTGEIKRELRTLSSTVALQSTSINNLTLNKLDNSIFNNFIENQYNPLAANVDAKIESFYQNTDPSTSWSTLLEKSTHKGDIWYDTASQRTYVYYEDTSTSPTSYYWQWQNVPTSLIDTVDGKGTIFVGTDIPSNPTEGDLWFKSVEEGIYTYVNNEWIEYNKYTDDTAANEAITQANDLADDLELLESDLHNNYVTTQTFDNTTGTLSTQVGVIERDYVKTTTLNQKSDEFQIAIENAQTAADNAQGDVNTINTTLHNYFTFADNGLTIAVGNSGIKLKLDNDSIDFMNGDKMIATWKITNGDIASSTLNLGQYQFTTRGSGSNMSLDFKHI